MVLELASCDRIDAVEQMPEELAPDWWMQTERAGLHMANGDVIVASQDPEMNGAGQLLRLTAADDPSESISHLTPGDEWWVDDVESDADEFGIVDIFGVDPSPDGNVVRLKGSEYSDPLEDKVFPFNSGQVVDPWITVALLSDGDVIVPAADPELNGPGDLLILKPNGETHGFVLEN